ncbi:host cell division inhibitor Icd-like protein [Haemophilus haemolyticus]|uniref:host cell division inhibitor Icd-like protein n=1 Tax=Haemophilus haemolyticus TaxID=726 RepID=UPI000E58C972|nr:host cell division inhibitor Icd-like protein [Haemophilus haemolyticus]
MPYRLWLEDILIILPVLSNLFTTSSQNGIILSQSEKVIASRGKLNYLTLANDSTPLNRAFFVRDIRTPKEFADFVFIDQIYKSLSMVERNEPSMTGCLPKLAVFHLVTFYRPTVESLAVVPENLTLELTQMYQFIFALIRAPQIKIRLLADTEQQARSRFTDGDTLLFVGKINQTPLKNNRTLAALPTLSTSAAMEVAHA